MTVLLQQILSGIAAGAIYASIGIALVLIFRSTGIANFAQGEMAMVSTYIAWQLSVWGLPLVIAALSGVVFGVALGVFTERFVVRRVETGPHLNAVILTFGLFLIFNQTAAVIWHSTSQRFPSLVAAHTWQVFGIYFSSDVIFMLAVLMVESVGIYVLLQRTRIGLWMRASAANPESAALVGIDVQRMLMLGWGLAGGFGAIGGILIASRTFLEPNMMSGVLLYAFAAIVLGGLTSVFGAVVGGLIIGILENLVGTYVPFLGPDLKAVVPLTVVVLVLLVRPTGLFGTPERIRV
ncbi:branched-chain amino acid ABC transporter permease [Pseudonocardia hispaniensis]|uniref:Branched-chain amino acid ABC transporter permease n=1 Tax=Pseudonocardia hispaniensis TaxID=904933 RepID=A0ABW1J158_9PSEU